MGAEVSDEESDLGSEVGSEVGFLLGGPGSDVGSAEGRFLGDSRVPRSCPGVGLSYPPSKSYR